MYSTKTLSNILITVHTIHVCGDDLGQLPNRVSSVLNLADLNTDPGR